MNLRSIMKAEVFGRRILCMASWQCISTSSRVTQKHSNIDSDGGPIPLDPKKFYQAVRSIGIDFFCGVPDSLLKEFTWVMVEETDCAHVVAPNEGSAVALAAGYHLATGRHALVYLQNSGLGNTVNPLVSLADPTVYRIPMLLFIGWRGEPGRKDEPQHQIQGQITPGILATLGIPFQALPIHEDGAAETLRWAHHQINSSGSPCAILVRRETFSKCKTKDLQSAKLPLTRESAVKLIVDSLNKRDIVIGTTGMLSRELFEHRASEKHGHEKDFLTVGSMGHASAIALGISLAKKNRQVYCLDGDGAVIMHMGNVAAVGHASPPNFKHIIINNGCHDSVGGLPTYASHPQFSFTKIALACGYKAAFTAASTLEVENGIRTLSDGVGPALLEVKVRPGGRNNLGRPTRTPIQNKVDFMEFIDSA